MVTALCDGGLGGVGVQRDRVVCDVTQFSERDTGACVSPALAAPDIIKVGQATCENIRRGVARARPNPLARAHIYADENQTLWG